LVEEVVLPVLVCVSVVVVVFVAVVVVAVVVVVLLLTTTGTINTTVPNAKKTTALSAPTNTGKRSVQK